VYNPLTKSREDDLAEKNICIGKRKKFPDEKNVPLSLYKNFRF
jgi:hypothetical protein